MGADGRQCCLSGIGTSLQGRVSRGPVKAASISALGMLPPPRPCVLAPGYSVYPRQAQGLRSSLQLAPYFPRRGTSRSRSLKGAFCFEALDFFPVATRRAYPEAKDCQGIYSS